MKKISLKHLNLNEVEQLSREQLKNVLGGFTGSGSAAGSGGSEYGEVGESPGMCDQESECYSASDCGYLGQYTCNTLTIKCNGVDYSWNKCTVVVRSA